MWADDQLDDQLREVARRSIERRVSEVDAGAALNGHRARLQTVRPSGRHTRRRLIAAALVLVAAAGVVSLAVSRTDDGSQTDALADDRPLAERLEALGDAPVSLSPPWWRGAVEASPATNFTLDGEAVDAPDLFVVGDVVAVNGIAGFSSNEGPRTAADLVAFNSPEAVSDIVVVTMQVDDGVAENGEPLPDRVSFVLSLPAPTDLPSLERELSGRLGAILFQIQYLDRTLTDRVDGELYDVLDGHFLGRVQDEEVVFGEFFPPNEFLPDEAVPISDIIAGAGNIEMVMTGGEPTRVN